MDNRLICLILVIQFTISSPSSLSSSIFDENNLEMGKIIRNSAKYLIKNHGHHLLKQSGRATTTSQVMITNYSMLIFLDQSYKISHQM